MNNKSIAIILLIVGLGIGYVVGANRNTNTVSSIPGGMHMLNSPR